MDIEVLGAGCLGLSAALELAQRGHGVTVADPRGVGAGATGKAAGIVSTAMGDDDDFGLVQQTRAAIGALVTDALMAGRPEARHVWRPLDSITIAAAEGLRTMDDVQHRLERHGEEPERLGHREAEGAFPALRFAPGEEVLVAQEDGAVGAGDLAQLLAWAVEEAGGRLQAGTGSDVASASAGTGTGASAGAGRQGGAADPDVRVVAAGAWTPSLLAAEGVHLPLASFRTQAARLALPGVDAVPIFHDTVHGFYGRPDSGGSLVVGDGTVLRPHDPDRYDEAASPEFRDSIAARVPTRVAGGQAAVWRTGWAGLCVATPDRRAVVGPVPDRDDLFVLSGDNGFGVMRCLGLGQRLADAVDGAVHARTDPARLRGAPRDFELREGFAW